MLPLLVFVLFFLLLNNSLEALSRLEINVWNMEEQEYGFYLLVKRRLCFCE